jgi:inner membrane protein
MLARTHLAFGFLSGLVLMNSIPTGNIFIFFGLILLGSVLPDIDAENSFIVNKLPWLLKPVSMVTSHRGVFHSLIGALLISGIVFYFISRVYGFALFLGYTSHLLIDGFTKMGVNFLHPISDLKLSGFIETGKLTEYVVLIVIIVLILLMLF